MMAYLAGGPANGRVIHHPHLHLFRVPIPKPLDLMSMLDCLNEAINDTLPVVPVANYEFTGTAKVNMNGDIQYMIYQYIGMDA